MMPHSETTMTMEVSFEPGHLDHPNCRCLIRYGKMGVTTTSPAWKGFNLSDTLQLCMATRVCMRFAVGSSCVAEHVTQ
jgi:hypothetical protein